MNEIITMSELFKLALREVLRQREIEEQRKDSRIKSAKLYKLDKKIEYIQGQLVSWEKSEKRNSIV